ncbi:MAG: peptidoglycan DD-metalloendopeptidase family protein [Oscillospiraceae bacterium]|nr:peptidoglycan DD-metalloendopeptidase family protein [Oscillospiraceae bacterium]
MKKNKKFVHIVAMILAVLMVLSLLVSFVPVYASAQVTQADIDAVRSERNKLSAKVDECKERLELLKTQEANVLETKAALTEQNKLAQEQIDLIQTQIDIYSDMIAVKAQELDEAINREELQLQRYRTRVRAMEENGGYNFLAILLNSSDFGELMSGVDDMGEIMESDRALEDAYIAAREETEEIKAGYEAEKVEYEGQQAELRAEQEVLKAQMEETTAMLEALAVEIETAIAEYKAAEAAEAAAAAEITNIIALYNAQKAAEAAALAAQQQAQQQTQQVVNPDGTVTQVTTPAQPSAPSGTGTLVWPVPSSMTITSRYGNRSDPFTGATAYHSGIDIDGFNKAGNPIIAADSGTVVTASSNSGYGNYVIIDHGGMKTVYAHMSGFAVSTGQTVSQGQTIGYLGDTGRATGVHLHFEVYVGESRTDPAAYFSGMSYYNC